MALPASSLFASHPKTQLHIKLFSRQPCQFHARPLLLLHPRLSPMCCMRIANVNFGDPNKVKLQLSTAKQRLWEASPSPVKEFPWAEAANLLLKRLMVIGQAALKWSLIALFVLSSVSDVIFSISRNQELMIPIGLLMGCLMTDFLKETLQELFQAPEPEDTRLDLTFMIVSCFFLLVKVISTFFTTRPQALLLHVANGGLLQVLWLWRCTSRTTE
ncbi:uncharacterized protein LOC126676609 [Mercurialis annua]|uniref:uncharacterized protein LOC126676609 n=1 Tax=Mercurialis annua TaxID=3986 RepID=UPI002160F0AF|nr:uncharacterized protein LOC126676609 [Mercurialis annua]